MSIRFILEDGAALTKAHPDDAGWDISALGYTKLFPEAHKLIRTGVYLDIPPGWYVQVVPRSGLASNHGITVLNSPGIVDAGYQGEILVNLINHGRTAYSIEPGDRIAQLIPTRLERIDLQPAESYTTASERGTGGHGSTGD